MLQIKVVEKIKTHFMLHNFFFFENCAVYEIKSKNILNPEATDNNRAHSLCRLSKATRARTHKYVHLLPLV